MVAAQFATSAGRLDARPVRPTATDTAWDQAVALRDRFAAEIRSTLDEQGIEAAIFFSQNGVYPPWVKLEAWLPAERNPEISGQERADLELFVDVKPYHEHETIVTARAARGKKRLAVAERPSFPVRHIREWTLYTLGRGPLPGNYTPVSDALRRIIHSFLPFISEPHRNRLQKEYRTRVSGAMLAGIASLLAIFFGGQIAAVAGPRSPITAVIPLAGVAGLIATMLYVRRRKRAVSVAAQPIVPPRNLASVDSWHVVVADLGRDFSQSRQRLVTAIAREAGQGVSCQGEIYTQRSPNGYEQRERLIVSKDQGVVHVHIYRFGNDIFVGWNAYVNWSQWGETNAVSMKIQDGKEIEFRNLRPALYIPSQFDLIDLSSLSEFVHRRLERELKAMMREKSIDQEIDFKIIRGNREDALDQSKHAGDGEKRGGWRYKTG